MPEEPTDVAGSRVLVTGASGFIGGHLCRRLSAAGAQVHAVSRRDRAGDRGVDRWWRTDLAEAEPTARLIAEVRPDLVFHLASHVYGSRDLSFVLPTFRDNLATTVCLLTVLAERGDCRLILSGSMEESRPGDSQIPSSPYAVAKTAAGAYARFFHHLYDLPVTMARIFMVYGPDQKDRQKLIPYVTRSLLAGESPELAGGAREVDWVYVEDVADALVTLAGRGDLAGQTIDVGSGERTSVRRVVEMLGDIIGGEAEPIFGAVAERPGETQRVADVEATAAATGWRARTSLRAGLERTVEWYLAQ